MHAPRSSSASDAGLIGSTRDMSTPRGAAAAAAGRRCAHRRSRTAQAERPTRIGRRWRRPGASAPVGRRRVVARARGVPPASRCARTVAAVAQHLQPRAVVPGARAAISRISSSLLVTACAVDRRRSRRRGAGRHGRAGDPAVTSWTSAPRASRQAQRPLQVGIDVPQRDADVAARHAARARSCGRIAARR